MHNQPREVSISSAPNLKLFFYHAVISIITIYFASKLSPRGGERQCRVAQQNTQQSSMLGSPQPRRWWEASTHACGEAVGCCLPTVPGELMAGEVRGDCGCCWCSLHSMCPSHSVWSLVTKNSNSPAWKLWFFFLPYAWLSFSAQNYTTFCPSWNLSSGGGGGGEGTCSTRQRFLKKPSVVYFRCTIFPSFFSLLLIWCAMELINLIPNIYMGKSA